MHCRNLRGKGGGRSSENRETSRRDGSCCDIAARPLLFRLQTCCKHGSNRSRTISLTVARRQRVSRTCLTARQAHFVSRALPLSSIPRPPRRSNENNALPYHMVPFLGGSPTALRTTLASSINHMCQWAKQVQFFANISSRKQPGARRCTHGWPATNLQNSIRPPVRRILFQV